MAITRKLIRSAAKCLTCETVIESRDRHDYVECACGRDSDTLIFVDGGTMYPRMGYGIKAEFEDLSEWEEYETTK